jgi:Rieske 2Fe-2S family protein
VAAVASTLQPSSIDSTQQAQAVRRTIVEQLQERPLNSGKGNGTGNELDFFKDADVHQNDLEALWYKEWIFAGHECELPKAGSYLALQIGDYPIVIVRAKDKSIRAFHNICRHRGFKICDDGNGVVMRRLMCPYHQWTYDLDGKLAFARDFGSKEDGFDKANYSLKQVALQVADGHLFVCVADAPKPFEPLRDQLESMYLAPFDLKRSKVAYQSRRIFQKNWKTVWKSTPEEGHGALARADGGMATIAPDRQYRFENLTKPGTLSENEGVMDHIVWHHYPNTWGNVKADHAISCRLLPLSATQTELLIKWVVPGDAEEGRDYSLEELTGVQRAEDLEQDAVESVHSSPALHGEDAALQFNDWYSESMVRALQAEVSIAA